MSSQPPTTTTTTNTPTPKLNIYRPLSPHAGIRVSPICLGAMTFGNKWSQHMSSISKEESFVLLDEWFFEMGGNFLDTACNYQDQESEKIIGEWMEERGVRDQIVLATKYTAFYKPSDPNIHQRINFVGNNIKNMYLCVEDSLKKLRTEYIDVLYVHWWDWDTSIKEVMDGLHRLVLDGKVLYLGISDTPAWIVSQANQYAECQGKTPFSIYQGKWSVLDRSFERDIIPMARMNGMALAPWGVIGGGRLRTDEEERVREESGERGRTTYGVDWKRTEDEKRICQALEKVANEIGVESIRAVAIAYVMQKTPYVFPIIGSRSVESFKENLEALNISLTPEQVQSIENADTKFDLGFPHNMVGDGSTINFRIDLAGKTQRVPFQSALRPPQFQED
ncbi:Aldo/keto reductase [Dendrothele bispora CBS 962.96]|uniref:Aldo/keto reductase n=1 Tax=Dendrothele bispora (strain CBS 962.96) TaxID=1314807 RepID=A0A4S8M4N6_DENBC|nr:Aldo/keto reductase [Dendrothele bispora CBS 962.96]